MSRAQTLPTAVIGILSAILLGWLSWTSMTLVNHGEALAATEVEKSYIQKRLDSIDSKLEILIQRGGH